MERYNGYYFTAKTVKGQWQVYAYLGDSMGSGVHELITKAMDDAVRDCRVARRLKRSPGARVGC